MHFKIVGRATAEPVGNDHEIFTAADLGVNGARAGPRNGPAGTDSQIVRFCSVVVELKREHTDASH